MTVAADLHSLSEDERISLIGHSVMDDPPSSAKKPPMAGFLVEDDAKADRYVRKLKKQFPGIRIVDRAPGPVAGTILVRVAGPLR